LRCSSCGVREASYIAYIKGKGERLLVSLLCELCAQRYPSSQLLRIPNLSSSLTCPACNFPLSDFFKMGKLGCPLCYEHFYELLFPFIKNIQR
jgi:protein-arginine kinase activator protein McsA